MDKLRIIEITRGKSVVYKIQRRSFLLRRWIKYSQDVEFDLEFEHLEDAKSFIKDISIKPKIKIIETK